MDASGSSSRDAPASAAPADEPKEVPITKPLRKSRVRPACCPYAGPHGSFIRTFGRQIAPY